MTPQAADAEIKAVIARLETTGVHVLVLPGELTTAIGAIGDPQGVAELGLEGMAGVDRVVPISRPYKLASSELAHHEPTVFRSPVAASALPTFCLIAGPCTVETARADAGCRARGGGGGRVDAPRRRLQAAHLAVRLPGARRGGAGDPRRRARGHGAAGGHRAARRPARRRDRHPCRRGPDRRAQHAELRAAGGRGQARQARAAQARAVLLARGAPPGRGLHPQGGQRGRDALRAGHPDVRDGHALHARPLRRAVAEAPLPPAGDRGSLARVRRPPAGGAALARGGCGRRRRDHRRGHTRPRRRRLRRSPGALRERLRRLRGPWPRTRAWRAAGWPECENDAAYGGASVAARGRDRWGAVAGHGSRMPAVRKIPGDKFRRRHKCPKPSSSTPSARPSGAR